MKKATCIVGAACAPPIWRKPTSTPPACTPETVGVGGVGTVGTGTRGSMLTRSSLAMASGIARSAGGSIPHGGSMTLRSSDMVTAMAVGATSIISAITVIGKHVHPTSQAKATPMVSIMVLAPRAVVFTRGLKWPAPEALEAAAFMKAEVFTEVADSVVAATVVGEATAKYQYNSADELGCGSRQQ